jgi:uncharacterized membrane protein
MIDWAHAAPSVTAAFLASLVEFVEALTIVLAVGMVRGWRSALLGTVGGVLVLALIVIVLGPALDRIPVELLQLVIGVLLLLFGMRWLRKAILRAGGIIALHDEAAEFSHEVQVMRTAGRRLLAGWDLVAAVASFKAVVLEGLEVVFIVIAVGAAGGMLVPASIGAAAAGVLVIFLGLVLHRPLARVPENALKFAVGVMLSAFGVFWIGEGLGMAWPGADLSILGIALAFLLVALLSVRAIRQRVALRPQAVAANEQAGGNQ